MPALFFIILRKALEDIIQEWETSGLSKMAYCHQKGLSRQAFYYWQKKLISEITLDSQDLIWIETHLT